MLAITTGGLCTGAICYALRFAYFLILEKYFFQHFASMNRVRWIPITSFNCENLLVHQPNRKKYEKIVSRLEKYVKKAKWNAEKKKQRVKSHRFWMLMRASKDSALCLNNTSCYLSIICHWIFFLASIALCTELFILTSNNKKFFLSNIKMNRKRNANTKWW